MGVANEAVGQLLADPNSDTVSFSYTSLGHLRRSWVGDAATVLTTDTDGRVLQSIDPRGTQTDITRHVDGWAVSSVRSAAGSRLAARSWQRDHEGRVLTECVERVDGACSDEWNDATPVELGRASDAERLLGMSRYTGEGRLATRVEPGGRWTTTSHDGLGRPVAEVVSNAGEAPRQATFTYDPDGAVSATTRGTDEPRTTTYNRDGFGRVVSVVDERGIEWHQAFTPDGPVAAQKRADQSYPDSPQGGGSWEAGHTYDGHGRVVQTDDGAVTTQLNRVADGRVVSRWQTGAGATWFAYDHAGRVTWSLDAAGTQTARTWDPASRTSTVTTLRENDAERLTTTVVAVADASGGLVDRLVVGHDGELQRTLLERDGLGEVTAITAADGVRTLIGRDLAGFTTSVARESGTGPVYETALYAHLPTLDGWLVDITDPTGQVSMARRNVWGEQSAWTTPGDRPEGQTWAYDEHGRVTTYTNAGGDVVELTYSLAPGVGETVMAQWPGAPTPGNTLLGERLYDDLGRLAQTTSVTRVPRDGGYDVVTAEHDFTHDANGRTTSQTLALGGPPLLTSADWSLAPEGGWTRTLTYPDGTAVTAEHDLAGRVATLSRDAGARSIDYHWLGDLRTGSDLYWSAAADPLRERAAHDGLGNRVGWSWTLVDTDNSGAPANPAWAGTYCGGAWDAARCDAPALDIDVRRDVLGRVRSLVTRWAHPFDADDDGALDPAPLPRWRGFDYDLRGRLSDLWDQPVDELDLPDLEAHAVDGAGVSVAAAGLGAPRTSFARALGAGSLVSIDRDGDLPWTDAARGPGHRLTSVRVADQVLTLTHDEAGRLIDIDPGFGLVYDPLDRLVAAIDPGGALLEGYVYDALGQLVATVAPDGTQTAIPHYGPQMIGAHTVEAGMWTGIWSAIWGPALDELVEWRDHTNGSDFAALTDHRRSIVAAVLLDADAAFTATADYDAHGRLSATSWTGAPSCDEGDTVDKVCVAPASMPFGFASAWRSQITGLIHFRNRWYSPRLGQFTSPDPLGFIDGFDVYGYAGFDPINGWDPSGLATVSLSGGGSGVRGTGTGPAGPGGIDGKSGSIIEKKPTVKRKPFVNAQTPSPGLPAERPPYRPPLPPMGDPKPPRPPRPPPIGPRPPKVRPQTGPWKLVKTIGSMCVRAPLLCLLAPIVLLQGDTGPSPVTDFGPDDDSSPHEPWPDDDLVPGEWVEDLEDLFPRNEDGEPIEWVIEEKAPTKNPDLSDEGVVERWYIRVPDEVGEKWSIDVGPGPKFRFPPHKSTDQAR